MRSIGRLIVVTLLLVGVRAQAQFLYGATGSASSPGELFVLDPATGTVLTDIGPLKDVSGNAYGLTGLIFDPSAMTLYGSTTNNSPTNPRSLVTIDWNNARVTPVGSYGIPGGSMADLTIDPTTGTLYGALSSTADLYSIDKVTGAPTAVGPSGVPPLPAGVGLASDAVGTLFGAPIGSTGDLVTYDKVTGAVTSVATLTGAPFTTGAINALAFDNGGTLFGVNVDMSNPARPTDLTTIDTSTGAVTDLGASANRLDAIAFVPFAPVPEPGVLALLTCGCGTLAPLLAWRRRSRKDMRTS